MLRLRRIGAYGIIRDGDRVLLTRGSPQCEFPGVWQLPGGGVGQGEHPADAVVREVGEETGLAVTVAAVHDVVADVTHRTGDARTDEVALHHDRVIYRLTVTGGTLRDEAAGTIDRAAWFAPEQLPGLRLMPMTAEILGLPVTPLPASPLAPPTSDAGPAPGPPPPRPSTSDAGPAPEAPSPEPPASDAEPPAFGQRFGAYALATDPQGRVLLSLISPGYPGGGQWHLPGGGTDHGEQPRAALLRELAEETDQVGRVADLLGVDSRHNPAELWRGRFWDWHVVRVVYRVFVAVPTPPRVTEVGGSTADARWLTPEGAADLPLTGLAAQWVRTLDRAA
ncbi:NUDIX hydrolase [Rhizomonospora bruguierae]|uniref:NUDIX hydrolase n=1 Tax=Rhizomonospora bruguierae TaxID=1581705 RepID=UPI001BD1BA3B|nr:NUDIX domain-containing protein [Micromonospora sp. NBRC 107566]